MSKLARLVSVAAASIVAALAFSAQAAPINTVVNLSSFPNLSVPGSFDFTGVVNAATDGNNSTAEVNFDFAFNLLQSASEFVAIKLEERGQFSNAQLVDTTFTLAQLFTAVSSSPPLAIATSGAAIATGDITNGAISFSNLVANNLDPGLYIARVGVNYKTSGNAGVFGDFTVVPLPAAAWLFGSAFLGLCWLGRRSGIVGVGTLPR